MGGSNQRTLFILYQSQSVAAEEHCRVQSHQYAIITNKHQTNDTDSFHTFVSQII